MRIPTDDIAGCKAAHDRLGIVVTQLSADVVRQPSLLPGWTVAHVLTHLARNADSVVRRLEGAARGQVVDQYTGGQGGKVAEIEAGAGRSVEELVTDVLQASVAVDAGFARFPDEYWDRMTRAVSGYEHSASVLPFRRWREVEVHLVDLGLGHTPSDWPEELVNRWLPELLPRLSERTEPRALLAWALRRGPAPELDPW